MKDRTQRIRKRSLTGDLQCRECVDCDHGNCACSRSIPGTHPGEEER